MEIRRTCKLLAAAALIGVGASGAAAQPFVTINTGPSLDTLYAFDPANPGAASTTPPIATLAGNFIRGFELDGPASGWYVCTSDIGGSPIGFFRYDGGVSTLVGPLPFESVSVGGMSLSQGGDFLYWVSDPPDIRDDLLLRIDFDGTITELAPITLAGQEALVFNGLAVHPTTGVIYASETNTDVVVTIDPATGVATPLGPSGVVFSAIGGMDFDQSNGELIFVNGRNVYQIDLESGAAALRGQLPVTTSSVSWVPGDTGPACPPDWNGDEVVNSSDISSFLTAWLASVTAPNTVADFNQDGVTNSSDISAFLTAWLDAVVNGC